MSELKVYHCNEWHNEYTEFYIKSEADKVIEEKDAEIAELKEHNENYRFDNKNMLNKIMIQDAELRHANYKRCLAMARWCDTKGDWYYSLGESFRDCVDFYIKWRDKWLKIADKFKEAK